MKKMNWHWKKLGIGVLAAALAGIGLLTLAGCNSKENQATEVAPVVSNTVSVEGHLQPATSTWLSFQANGRVDEVLVKEGDKISSGQPLVRLEGSDRAEAQLKAAQSANFLAQQNLTDAQNSDSLKGAAEVKLAAAQKAYNDALDDYYDRNDQQGNDQQIALYEAKVTMAQDKVDKLQDKLDGMGELSDDDVSKAKVIADLNQAKIDLDNIKKLRDYFEDKPDDLDLQTISAKLDSARAALSDAQRDYDRVKDGLTKEALAAYQSAADAAAAAEQEAQWNYDQLVLTAPYDGTFVQCDLTKGQFVTAGTRAALVADLSNWLIETDDLDEIKAAEIDTTKPVAITADALPDKDFTGKVDRILQNYTDDNGDIEYTAKIKIDKPDPALLWGMTMQLEFQKK